VWAFGSWVSESIGWYDSGEQDFLQDWSLLNCLKEPILKSRYESVILEEGNPSYLRQIQKQRRKKSSQLRGA
jgi:hypothetical protein